MRHDKSVCYDEEWDEEENLRDRRRKNGTVGSSSGSTTGKKALSGEDIWKKTR